MKTLSDQTTARFSEKGFFVVPEMLEPRELQTLRRCCDELLDEPVDDNNGGKSHDIGRGADRRFLRGRHMDYPDLQKFVLGETMRELATNVLGTEPYLFNEQFVVKGAKTGASFAWHQDSAYVGFDHKPYVTIWMALDDTTVENGAVFILPRNIVEHPGIVPHHWDLTGKELVGYSGKETGEPAEVKAGSVVVFSSLTLHRSSPNTTDRKRRAYIAQYSPEPINDPSTGRPKTFAKKLNQVALA